MITSDLVRQRVQTLPSLPTTVVALGRAVADERCTVDRVLGLLGQDPGLSSVLLRLANSAAYARDSRVMDLRSAVLRLGFDTIYHLGQSAAIIRAIPGGRHLDPVRLWQHSVAVGQVAQGLCVLAGQGQHRESAYLAGLLHDIGKIALDQCFAQEYAPVVEALEAGAVCLDAERSLLGVTHAEVGAMLARQWNFPDPMAQAIQDHHAARPGAFLAGVIQLADLLVRTRIPNSPADENLAFVLEEEPAFGLVFRGAGQGTVDEERLTFGIDDELDHAIAFVKLIFQE